MIKKYIILKKSKDLTKLIKKIVIDKNGHPRTVYVKIKDNKKSFIYHNNNFTKEKNKEISNFINSIRNSKVEKVRIYDKNGSIIVNKTGGNKNINFSNEEYDKINNTELLAHNHPSNDSFSFQDVFILLDRNIKEIMACGRSTNFSLSMKKKMSEEKSNEIYKYYKKITEDKILLLRGKIDNGEITIKEAEKNFSHPLMKQLIKKYGEYFEYKHV